ncbi:polyphosphoinositide phosphatase isoform X2 [Anabrus simplex]|uniref:polyphosphoinositide phosphatase isoform X2 n=1 Tax=Anabrus simplex TaxID=316456 RepID=UPI0035A312BF
MKSEIVLHPIISSIQKVALYETKARFYLMGSNNTQTRFRVLKIDRMEPRELVVVDDKIEYSQEEIRDLVTMIDMGNRTRVGQKSSSNGVSRVVSAFGIVGFVKFLEGYYIILVTKRRRVAVIGHHTVYKIEDTTMIYIPNDGVRVCHPDEARYVKMFQNIDLSSNFYFSYSYDLTHSLQSNLTSGPSPSIPFDCNLTGEDESKCIGVRTKPNRRFVWNSHLLKPIEAQLHPDWILYVMHGFVGQSNMSIYGRSVYVTLLARRSNKYAGTRFLKRGANFEGDVANEVETEQMVHDSGVSSLSQGRFTSFVQMRGSVPAHWSQDTSKMVPKPAIGFDLSDPFAETAGGHFNQLMRRYGSPIIILNLVKKREKKKHESMLSEEFSQAVRYLNQFLPSDHHIQYISFDMARMNKGKEANVMGRLAEIARSTVCKTGIFQSQEPYFSQNPQSQLGQPVRCRGRLQTGIIRVNCVDCLDRTNTAQFAIGKCALAYQLCALGLSKSPKLDFDSDCVRMLEELYEDHGDTLALQYGGSQLVHRIKTYRKTAPWTSQGNDIMQTLSRYYSNTFSDAEKQHTINLFLGLFVPEENKPPIWELVTDYYLHHTLAMGHRKMRTKPLTQWWDTEVLRYLPLACDEVKKEYQEVVKVSCKDERVDGYLDYHRPYEMSVLSEMYVYKISHSVRDFMPHCTTDFSPFTVRARPGRRREESTPKAGTMKNPSLTGQSSTSSTTSSASSSMESEDTDEDDHKTDSQLTPSKDTCSGNVTFEALFPPMRQVYGMEVDCPKKADINIYKRFVLIGRSAYKKDYNRTVRLVQQSSFLQDSSRRVSPPRVSPAAKSVYQRYVDCGTLGASEPSASDLIKYQKFVSNIFSKSSDWDSSL